MSQTTESPGRSLSEENSRRSTDVASAQSPVSRYLRKGFSSGLFAAVAGLVSLTRVRRALRDGSSDEAMQRATMAVFWIGVAMTQWGRNRATRRASPLGAVEGVQ